MKTVYLVESLTSDTPGGGPYICDDAKTTRVVCGKIIENAYGEPQDNFLPSISQIEELQSNLISNIKEETGNEVPSPSYMMDGPKEEYLEISVPDGYENAGETLATIRCTPIQTMDLTEKMNYD